MMLEKPQSENSLMQAKYERARSFEQESFTKKFALNSAVYPKWVSNRNQFLYQRQLERGKSFRLVDANNLTNIKAFDHEKFGSALSQASGHNVVNSDLPISELNVSKFPDYLDFEAFDKSWRMDLREYICDEMYVMPAHWLVSPDGSKAVFLRDHNLWLRCLRSDTESPLTHDGQAYFSYGVKPERTDLTGGLGGLLLTTSLPQALWSPDSKKLFTMKTDERKVDFMPLNIYVPKEGSIRPKAVQRRYALPGDVHIAEYNMICIDVESGEKIDADYSSVLDVGDIGPFQRKRTWWSKDSKTAYFVDMARGEKRARVVGFDADSGATEVLLEETSETYIDLHFLNEEHCTFLPLLNSHEIVWWSERTGWAHLYVYCLKTGKLKRALTEGPWIVREILYFDEERRDIFIQVAGRAADCDPYYREICRVNVDTGEFTSLAAGDCDYVCHKEDSLYLSVMKYSGHDVSNVAGLSMTGNYMVTTCSRIDEPPQTEIRDRDGQIVMVLETADVSALPKGWQWPEPVKLLAGDGKTDVYGAVFRPTDFDPDSSYPVIDYTLCFPVITATPKAAFCSDAFSALVYLSAAAWAELGFIVVVIDGRGTTFRDKKFHHASYGQVHTTSNLEDHIAGIKQLAKQYPYMDLERVGIVGPGACNGPAYGLLAYPAFYKVGVAASIYDVRLVLGLEIYQGHPKESDYATSVLGTLAENLKGNLLLIHGMVDNFFHPACAMQFTESLIEHNKVFDQLLLPNGGHMLRQGYALRRAWDYMVEHLQGKQPPKDFSLLSGKEYSRKVCK